MTGEGGLLRREGFEAKDGQLPVELPELLSPEEEERRLRFEAGG